MIEKQDSAQDNAARTTQMIRNFISMYDVRSVDDRQLALRIRSRLHSELYRRERAHAEWIDIGGEA